MEMRTALNMIATEAAEAAEDARLEQMSIASNYDDHGAEDARIRAEVDQLRAEVDQLKRQNLSALADAKEQRERAVHAETQRDEVQRLYDAAMSAWRPY